jgi:hypothetical protein
MVHGLQFRGSGFSGVSLCVPGRGGNGTGWRGWPCLIGGLGDGRVKFFQDFRRGFRGKCSRGGLGGGGISWLARKTRRLCGNSDVGSGQMCELVALY